LNDREVYDKDLNDKREVFFWNSLLYLLRKTILLLQYCTQRTDSVLNDRDVNDIDLDLNGKKRVFVLE
jgi:hypothetical protein